MERLSSIKNKQVIPSQNVWLIVFPLEIEFTATVDYPTVLYFEKSTLHLRKIIRSSVTSGLHSLLPKKDKDTCSARPAK